MVDISNKALALVLVAAIVVSLGGTMVSLDRLGSASMGVTGFATSDTGTANLSIENDLSLQFTVTNADFGAGFANNSDNDANTIEYCTFDSNGTNPTGNTCSGFNSNVQPLVVENIGNTDISNLRLEFNTTNATIGGTLPEYNFSMEINETGSCPGTLAYTNWTRVQEDPVDFDNACDQFSYLPDSNSLNISIAFSIPTNATLGEKSFLVTATAVS